VETTPAGKRPNLNEPRLATGEEVSESKEKSIPTKRKEEKKYRLTGAKSPLPCSIKPKKPNGVYKESRGEKKAK